MAAPVVRPQQYRLTWPLTAPQLENVDEMFATLFRSLRSTSDTAGHPDASSIINAKDLTAVSDTNVTLALGGTPIGALLQNVSVTLGWSGTLGLARGGTSADLSATGGAGQVLKQVSGGAAITVATLTAAEIASPAALTRVNDTNITVTLGGSPASALLAATSLTLGWSGTLSLARGGSAADLSATGGTKQYVKQAGVGAAFTVGTIPASDIASGAALTKTDDTNVTLTLGGTPATSLLVAASLTLGWTGTLAVARGGIGVGTLASNGVLYGNGTSAVQALAVNATATRKWLLQVSSAAPTWDVIAVADVTGAVSGSGTANTIAKFSSASVLANSAITEASGVVSITAANATLNVMVSGSTTLTIQPQFIGTSTNDFFGILSNNTVRGRVHASGGLSWGDTTDPGATNLRVAGTSALVGAVTCSAAVTCSSTLAVNGATITLTNASAELQVKVSGGVTMTLQPGFFGTSSNDPFVFLANNGTAGKIHASKGFSWGDTTDPGNTNFRVAGATTLVGDVVHSAKSSYNGEGTASLVYDGATKNNDVAPGTTTRLRVSKASGAGVCLITGFSGGFDGRILFVENVDTANSITFKVEDTGSTAGNRIAGPVDITVNFGDIGLFLYDSTTARWRPILIR